MGRRLPVGHEDALQVPATERRVAGPSDAQRLQRGPETRRPAPPVESRPPTHCSASSQVCYASKQIQLIKTQR